MNDNNTPVNLYTAEISRANPSCFLFVIDQSGSMIDALPNQGKNKAQGVADAINRLLQNLVIKCARSEGMRDYYHIGVIGYGQEIGPAFGGPLAGRDLVPISEIGNNPARVEERVKKVDDGAGGLLDQKVKFAVWFDAKGNGGTPMCAALQRAHAILSGFLAQHPNCFPPVVIHITDGESGDGNPSDIMTRIKALASTDGNTLLYNLHLSANPNAAPVTFPDSPAQLPDEYARTMFAGASVLTPFMQSVAREQGLSVSANSRSFVLNADLALIIQALEIGTRPSNLR